MKLYVGLMLSPIMSLFANKPFVTLLHSSNFETDKPAKIASMAKGGSTGCLCNFSVFSLLEKSTRAIILSSSTVGRLYCESAWFY